jgi:nucleoside-diphosphate-sugar epimerase
MSKILITGGSGFIGKSLLNHLVDEENVAKQEILLLSSSLHPSYETMIYDKESYLIPFLPKIDRVIHLGAFIPKSADEANRFDHSLSNIIFTKNLLNVVSKHVKHFIFISTSDVYETAGKIIDETSDTKPQTMYGWSKLYCEQMVITWCTNNRVPYKILRLGHIYGKGEDAYKKIIPVTIKKILKNEIPVIY